MSAYSVLFNCEDIDMANSAQAKKRARQNKTRAVSNMSQKSALRTAVKKVIGVIAARLETTKVACQKTAKALDMAASRGVIHKNKAARLKSRINAKHKAAL